MEASLANSYAVTTGHYVPDCLDDVETLFLCQPGIGSCDQKVRIYYEKVPIHYYLQPSVLQIEYAVKKSDGFRIGVVNYDRCSSRDMALE